MKRMRTTQVIGLIGLLSGSAWAFAQETAPPPEPAPRLVLSTTEWDFGAKWHGEPCSTEITIENAGTALLKIERIRSSCGCTVAEPKKTELLPGESDTMTLSYNTKKNARNVSQTITLETNDPQQPRVAIRIKGEVRHLFDARPAHRITFGRLDRDSASTQSIELTNNMERKVPLKLKPLEQDVPFEIKLEEVEHGMVYKLSATTRPPLKLGANVANIVLETGVEDYPTITIPASVYIAPQVAVMPPRLYVTPRVTKPFQRIVRVTYRPDDPVKVKEIKSSHPDLITAELLPPREEKRPTMVTQYHEIRVTLPPGNQLPEGGATLEIYTDAAEPEYQKLIVEIKLRAVSRPAGEPKPGEKKPKEEPEE
jgi:hypothetical protein